MTSVKSYVDGVRRGSVSIKETLAESKQSLKDIQKKYSPMITINEGFDKEEPKKGRLCGLPVSIKDNICTKGLRTTAGSMILNNYVPPFDAFVARRVKEEGGVIIGKTAMDEFGHGTFSVNCAFGVPKNPFDIERSCGGSSGGAGCLTAAADFPHAAIAESTGGSISCPVAFTGTVGITPTYGRVSRYGLIDYANSLDKIGTIGKTVYDATLLLSVIAGYDECDSTSINKPTEDYTAYLKDSVRGMRIGVPKEYFGEGIDERVKDSVWDGIKKLEGLGASYSKCSLPHTDAAVAAYYIIAMAETSTNLAKFCGIRYGSEKDVEDIGFNQYFSSVRTDGFGNETKRRIILGTYARMAGYRDQYYMRAMQARSLIIQDFKRAFKKFDVLISPTMPLLPPKFSEIEKFEPIQVYMLDILTVPPNLAGIPMISVPCGSIGKLPVGMHILADHLQERKMLQVAYTFERANG